MQKVFIIEDDRILRVTFADDLKDAGFTVFEFAEPKAALLQLKEQDVDIVFCDLKLPQMDGIEFLTLAKKIKPDVSVVIMTSYATYPEAVTAIKLGAYDFITKPFNTEDILILLEKNKEFRMIKNENIQLRTEVIKKYDLNSFIGSSDDILEIKELLKKVIDTGSTILITGETGTGKELLAKLIHYNSSRSKYPLIKVSCAILAREIFESELFGHAKGAFTGADKDKKGRFEIADKGTLYLDDIDDLPYDLQVKLLRVLEEREIERVGSAETIKIDVRLIASTKKDLKKLAAEGKFREDLFYRLNVFPVSLKPLRERKDDIPELFYYFLNQFSEGSNIKAEDEVLELLKKYNWPGNNRELKNMVERLVILCRNNVIDAGILPAELAMKENVLISGNYENKNLVESIAEFEQSAIINAVTKFSGNLTKASQFLGIPHSTLRSKIEKYGIKI